MQSLLPAEPGNRNIKAVDLADSAEIAKIVETTALGMDARQHPRQIPLILRSRATSSGCRFFSGTMAVPGFVASARVAVGCLRRAMMRPSNDGLGRAERDHHDRKKHSRNRSHAIRKFSALSLPRFATMSYETLAPSASDELANRVGAVRYAGDVPALRS